jgi:hypothetical protein
MNVFFASVDGFVKSLHTVFTGGFNPYIPSMPSLPSALHRLLSSPSQQVIVVSGCQRR